MVISARNMLLGLCLVVFFFGFAPWPTALSFAIMASSLLAGALVIAKVPQPKPSYYESQKMSELPQKRQHELLRGTGLHLREMKYRYSVRIDHNETAERCCFNADVNSIKLGFVPVVITDNATDKQGFGYAAFVFDGNRWLGPGLPCPGTKEQAIAHAQKSVAPPENDANEQ